MGVAMPSPDKDAVAAVLLAGRGRIRMEEHGEISAAELAAVTGYTHGYVRQLVLDGALERAKGQGYRAPISAKSAHTLLAQRGERMYVSAVASADQRALPPEGGCHESRGQRGKRKTAKKSGDC